MVAGAAGRGSMSKIVESNPDFIDAMPGRNPTPEGSSNTGATKVATSVEDRLGDFVDASRAAKVVPETTGWRRILAKVRG